MWERNDYMKLETCCLHIQTRVKENKQNKLKWHQIFLLTTEL